jgi:uncharacterized membrane protein (UPF0127 family)
MRVVTVVNETRGPLVGDRVQIAGTSLTRMVGLLGKSGLEAGGGLWIKPSSGVHTVGMRFTIDVIGLDKNLKVIKLWKRLVPYRLTTVHWNMSSVIELAAGRIDECQVQVGDVLSIRTENSSAIP